MRKHRLFLTLAWLTLASSADAREQMDIPRATLLTAENATPAAARSTSRQQMLDAAGRAVSAHAAQLGVAIGQQLQPASMHASQHGTSVVTYQQALGSHEVWGGRIVAVLDSGGTVRALAGGFSPNVSSAATTAFKLNAATALQALLKNSGITSGASTLQLLEQRDRYSYFSVGSSSFRALRPLRLKPVYFPAKGRLIAAYYVELFGWRSNQAHAEGWGAVVSAEDGSILQRTRLIHDLAHAYRVFSDAKGTPLENAYGDTAPHPTAIPDGWLPGAPAPMQLMTLDHAGISTGDPWLPAGATHTEGNNVDAFFNSLVAIDGVWDFVGDGPVLNPDEGDFRAPLTGPASFDYRYDVGATSSDYWQVPGEPATPIPTTSTQLNAKIVQAFYAVNWLHDLFYDLGFDEAAGNAQQLNYGRGGLAGDRVVVNPGFLGTFTFAPADGDSPQLYLGPNNFSGSLRDPAAFDFSAISHEWTHILFGRTAVAGPSAQNQALNEGTADFVAMLLSVRESDRNAAPNSMPFSGAYAAGAYTNLDYDLPWDTLPAAGSPGYPDNTYYHGIRRFPYSADMTINPLTLRHIGYSNELPAFTPPPNDWKFRSLANPQIHSAGEVWASALWQCARNILADESRSTFETRRRRILAHLVTGLKMFPTDADFIEARNAVLFAMRASDMTDYELCRRGFAKRGFGVGALAPKPADASNDSVKQSFSSSDAALTFVDWRLTGAGGDGDGALDFGESGQLVVTLKNTGLTPLTEAQIHVPAAPGVHVFPSGSSATGITLQPNEEYTTGFDVRLVTLRGASKVTFKLTARDEQRADAHTRQHAEFTVNYDLTRDSTTDPLISEQSFAADWTTGFEPEHGCPVTCETDLTNWRRTRHRGRYAYRIGSDHIGLDAHLTTVPFEVRTDIPLRIVLTHDYDLTRTSLFGGPTEGVIEISMDGGAWESVATHLVTGSASYAGDSGGWQRDMLDLGNALGGHSVQLRWRMKAGEGFDPQPVHWALARIEIRGAATPVFSSMYVEPR